jgi:glycosyltransferase involved in cell wall biosynthesis
MWLGLPFCVQFEFQPFNTPSVRILHVIIGLGAGGAEHMLRRLIESHRGTEFRHSVISLTNAGELGDSLRSTGIDVQCLGMRSLANAPITVVRLAKFIRWQKPDVVQTWMYHADLLGGLAARMVGNTRVIWGIRNTDMLRGTAYGTFVIRRICALLSHFVPAQIVCAAEASRSSHAAIGYDESRMVVVANGFDVVSSAQITADRSLIRTSCGWTDDEVVVGCVGRFNFYKDHPNFVLAAGLLARRFSSVRFVMVGKGLDAENKELSKVIAATGYASRFQLMGFRKDVPKWLSSMDVFCLSSRSEGFPNVVGEAMSIGIPCVATNVGDVGALLSDTGIVVPKENAQALYEGLAQVVAMPHPQRAAMGERGHARLIERFSMARATEKFEAIYRSVATRALR